MDMNLSNEIQLLQFTRMCRIPSGLVSFVEVEPQTTELQRMSDIVELKACFNNAAKLVMILGDRAKYCLGYAAGVIPVEHAWIRLDGKSYDPTWEKYSTLGSVYGSIFEFTREELFDVLDKNNNVPPSMWDLARLKHFEPAEAVDIDALIRDNVHS